METGTKASKTIQLRSVQGSDDEHRRDEERRRAKGALRPPPREPEGGEGEEVEDGLAGQDREAPEQAGGERGLGDEPSASAASRRSMAHHSSTMKTVSTQKWDANQTSSG